MQPGQWTTALRTMRHSLAAETGLRSNHEQAPSNKRAESHDGSETA